MTFRLDLDRPVDGHAMSSVYSKGDTVYFLDGYDIISGEVSGFVMRDTHYDDEPYIDVEVRVFVEREKVDGGSISLSEDDEYQYYTRREEYISPSREGVLAMIG